LCVIVNVGDAERVAVGVDASEGADIAWTAISRGVDELLGHPSYAAQPLLYFPGNTRPHPAVTFGQHKEEWPHANAQRARLLRPVYEDVQRQGIRKVLVFAGGRLFDVEDWLDTPLVYTAEKGLTDAFRRRIRKGTRWRKSRRAARPKRPPAQPMSIRPRR